MRKKTRSKKSDSLLKTVIEPNGKNLQYWKDIWRYRELAFNLAKRDITVRYKQTVIGFGWSIIAPILNMFVMTFVFQSVAGMGSDGSAPYAVMVYAGLIPWTLFSKAVTVSATTFITNAQLMKKVYFPRIISPLGATLSAFVDAAISYAVLLLIIVVSHFTTGFTPSIKILLSPLCMLVAGILGFFAGLFLSPFNIKSRDLNQALPFILSFGQYVTPVAYSFNEAVKNVHGNIRYIYEYNPVAGVINLVRWSIIPDNAFHWPSFISALVCIAIFIPLSIKLFRKGERTFVDLV